MSVLFDPSILPGCSSDSEKSIVPGTRLYPISEGYRAGLGCYEIHGFVFSSLTGYTYVYDSNDADGNDIKVVEIRKKFNEKHRIVPVADAIVTARVEAIGPKSARCSIICVENNMLNHEFNSTLRREDIRPNERGVDLLKCVQPGDFILSRVLGHGDAQSGFLISIVEDELGVILAQSGDERLIPYTSELVRSPTSNYTEPRKVALVPNMNS